MSWVLRHSPEKLGSRLVLLVLADHANSDGVGAYPSLETIANEARLSERQARRCLRGLEASSAIKATGMSSYGTTVYDVLMGGDILSGGDIHDSEGGTSMTENVSQMTPEPSLNRPSTTEELAPLEDPPTNGVPEKVDRKRVNATEATLATQILEYFNWRNESRFAAKGFYVGIVGRIREHPELTLAHHQAVIEYVLVRGSRWWQGRADPRVIYGKDSLFESALEAATHDDGSPREFQSMTDVYRAIDDWHADATRDADTIEGEAVEIDG